MPDMHQCPPNFCGTLAEFVNQHVEPNLLSEKCVADFHNGLMQYIHSNDAIYILRKMGETIRFRKGRDENIYSTNERLRFKVSDNSPAWWIHYLLFHGDRLKSEVSFQKLIDDIPTHFHFKPNLSSNIKGGKTINSFGYHVAHIYDVKDGKTDYKNYSAEEIIKRFIRNIHPLNYFYISTVRWGYYGKKIEIRSFFANLFSNRYRNVWDEFIELAQPKKSEKDELVYKDSYASFHYCYSPKINSEELDPSDRFILVGNVPTMMIDVNWTRYGGWKPWQYKSDMDQLYLIPGSRIRFNLLKNGTLKYCMEMDLKQWKDAMQQQMGTLSWTKYKGFLSPLTKKRNGQYTETFQSKWKHVKTCPCEKMVPTICKPKD